MSPDDGTQAPLAAEQERRLYEAILSATPDLVYMFDLDHRFTYANQALLQMWGKTLDESVGRNCLELGYEPWHAEMHDREIEQVIATRRPVRGEVPFNGTNGRRFYDYIFVPVFGPGGDVVAIGGTTRDITDRKGAEDALRASEQQLAEANRLKDEFLATLSHELRTPLNAILGWAHMLQTAAPLRPDLLERGLQSIDRSAKAQTQLVDDLLDVSRVISGTLAIKTDEVNLRSVIGEAVDAARPSLTAKALRLRMTVDTDADIVIRGDGDRLRQVVANLMSNAVKFTPPGGAIDIDVKRIDGALEISVRDTGVGIDAAFLPHVFERFRQADGAPSRQHGGLGLGLAIVRHLVEAHGGSVAAQSGGHGAGATFIVRLPLAGARPRPLPAVATSRPAPAPAIDGLRVLIADDDPDAREITRGLLEQHGSATVTASNAAEALQALRESRFDALIADIGMPDQDGYSLMREVRQLPPDAGGDIPAIAVTAYTTPRDRDQAINAGFTAHVGKPFNPERLLETLKTVTNGSLRSSVQQQNNR